MQSKNGQARANEREPGTIEKSEFSAEASASSDRDRITKIAHSRSVAGRPTQGLTLFLKSVVPRASGENMIAIDMSAGDGSDTRTLAAKGWQVHAIDSSSKACKVLSEMAARLGENKIKVHQGTLLDPDLEVSPASVNLVNARLTLPFVSRDDLPPVLARIAEVLQPGGYLCASFLGHNHSWNQPGKMNGVQAFHSETEVETLLMKAGFSIRQIKPFSGPLNGLEGDEVEEWHQISVIAQKPRRSSDVPIALQLRGQLQRQGGGDSMPPGEMTGP